MSRWIPRVRLAAPAALAAAMALTGAAQAQSAQPPRSADPLNPRAAVPPPAYRSALHGYRTWAEVQATPWRAANDEVARIGGWRAYAREAQASAPTPTPAHPAASAAAAPRP